MAKINLDIHVSVGVVEKIFTMRYTWCCSTKIVDLRRIGWNL